MENVKDDTVKDTTTAATQTPPPEPAKEPVKEPAPEQTLSQILLKVPPSVKEKAQAQADLAYKYGWIKSSTLTQLFIWVTDNFLDASIKEYIQKRRKSKEVKPS